MGNEQNMLYVLASVMAIAGIYFLFIRPRLVKQPHVPYAVPVDTSTEVANDKMIMVSNITQTELQESLIDFCDLFNNEATVVYPQLVVTNDGRLVVTFPYDVSFEPFCSLVNYLVYAPEVHTEPVAIGWGTFNNQEEIMPKEILDKPVMVFVPEEDANHMQLFIVSHENIGYHLPLNDHKKYKIHPEPEERYMEPPLDLLLAGSWAREWVDVVEK